MAIFGWFLYPRHHGYKSIVLRKLGRHQLPNPQATPFSTGLGVGTQINDFSKNDGYAPYSEQWNVNVQRRIPYDIFITAAWVGNRVIHLPSQLNTPISSIPRIQSGKRSWTELCQRLCAGQRLYVALCEFRNRLRRLGDGWAVAHPLPPIFICFQQF